MDILIYAKPEVVEHKFDVGNSYYYWTGKIPAKEKLDKVNIIYFSNGRRIFAKAYFYKECTIDEKLLCFSRLMRVSIKQPRKPPTRGWCYINK